MTDIHYGGNGSSGDWSSQAFPTPKILASSFAVTPLEILTLEEEYYTHGTAFVYRCDSEMFLVTAWHVVSGRDFFSRVLNKDGLIPSKLRFYVPRFQQTGEYLNISSEPLVLELSEEAQERLAVPPVLNGISVDVAVAKLPMSSFRSGDFTAKGMNEFEWGLPKRIRKPIRSAIGSDVFIPGYPLKTYEGLKTPIWKRGSIATEPGFQITPAGAFLVDINSTGGMSGAPIIRRVITMVADNLDDGVIEEFIDEAIVGIYSGRALSSSEPTFAIGYGWPIDFVDKIIEEKQCFSG